MRYRVFYFSIFRNLSVFYDFLVSQRTYSHNHSHHSPFVRGSFTPLNHKIKR